MGGSINGGTPKWMVIVKNPLKIDDLGISPFMEPPIHISYNHIYIYTYKQPLPLQVMISFALPADDPGCSPLQADRGWCSAHP